MGTRIKHSRGQELQSYRAGYRAWYRQHVQPGPSIGRARGMIQDMT